MAKNCNGMGHFGWFLTGIALGAVGGVLSAPKGGTETRSDLLANAKATKEKGAALTTQAAAKAGAYVQQGKEVATQYVEQGTALASDHLARASAALGAAKTAYAESASQKQPAESTFDMGSSIPEPGV